MNLTDKMEPIQLSTYLLSEIEKTYIKTHLNESIEKLFLTTSKNKPERFKILAEQIQARQKIKEKLPSWFTNFDLFLPKTISLEQSSSEITANYKSNLAKGKLLIDLTGGMGIDFFEMSQNFQHAIYIDQNEDLKEIATYNASVLNIKNTEIICCNSIDYLQNTLEKATWIFVDPARRNEHGGKVFSLNDCEPNVIENLELLLEKSENLLIKCSPMLDIDLAISQLKYVSKVHILTIENEVKELLFEINKLFIGPIEMIAVQFTKGKKIDFQYKLIDEKNCENNIGSIKKYLYEPHAGIMKAGAFKIIAQKFDLGKLHTSTHLYTSDKLIDNFPGRSFEIKAILKPNKQAVKAKIPNLKANLTIRNFPDTVANLRKKLFLRDGGLDYLFACTNHLNEKIVLQTIKIN
jgi:16S rRNA G966 N2-methylase RsmD